MASGAPVVQKPGSVGPVRSVTRSDTRVVASVVLGAYVTGGIVVTLPDEVKGLDLVAINVMNPIIDVAGDELYSWNGDAAAPKITATVISTGAQLGNGVATSANPLWLEFILAQ